MKFLLLLLCLAAQYDAYKILLYNPIFGHSHVSYLAKLADILTDHGHNITVVSPVLDTRLLEKKFYKTKINQIILEPHPDVIDMIKVQNEFMGQLWTMKPNPMAMITRSKSMIKMFTTACDTVIQNDTLLELLKNENFDLGFAEPFTFCGFGMMEAIKIRATVGTLATIHLDHLSAAIGEPVALSYVPSMMSTDGPVMTFFQRVKNVINGVLGNYFFKSIFDSEHQLFVEKFGSDFKSLNGILADMNYLFTNANPYLNYPKPTIHKVVEIGSVTVDRGEKAAAQLDETWHKILDERPQTVLVSFGSVAKSKDMPQNFKDNLLKVFASMPDVTFIWKYEEDSNMADHLPNVHLSKWTPQVALLNDPRLTLFVTHGGLGSTTELSHLGKPAIFIPVFAEQPRNAAMLSRHGGSTYLLKEDLGDPQKIEESIRSVLEDPSYAENARNLADLLNNQPIDVTEKFVKHVEFAAKFGRINNLDPHGRHLSLIEYYLIDVVLFVLSVIFVVLLVVFMLLRCLVRKCCCKSSGKPKKD